MKVALIILGVIVGILLLLVVWGIGVYNSLVKKKMRVEEGYATMDVYLKKRFDLIPNLVATVKGYAKHEAETLEKVIMARNSASVMMPEARFQDENSISGALKSIFVLSESYPELKANANFMQLTSELKHVEDDIAAARKYYNAVVKEYNTAIMTVPTNLIASMFKFKKQQMFEVDSQEERKNVTVAF